MHQKTLTELHLLLKQKQISSLELTNHYLKRIAHYNPCLNAFITITKEHALATAKQADQRLAQGQAHPLTGIPIAYKDNFCTQGIKTSSGSKMLDSLIPKEESHISQCLKKAGSVLLGKTNMDEFAMGDSNETSYYGAVRNPWHTDYVPGGSSGGSAAALAARLTPAAIGSDTGGSVRQPAAWCGILGLKPSYGHISCRGMIAFSPSLDSVGILTQSAEDAALLLQTLSKAPIEPPSLLALKQPIDGLKIGLPQEYFDQVLSSEVGDGVWACIQALKKQGVTFIDISLPHTSQALATYYAIASLECAQELERFDPWYNGKIRKPIDDLGDEVKRRLLIGTYLLHSAHPYYQKAEQMRRLIRDDFLRAYRSVDVILTPSTPTTAFKLGKKSHPETQYLSDRYTMPVNLAGLCALSMPVGFYQGLPIGAQLIGHDFSEARILNLAYQYQKITDWHRQFPSSILSS